VIKKHQKTQSFPDASNGHGRCFDDTAAKSPRSCLERNLTMNVAQTENTIDRSQMLQAMLEKERADILTRLHDFRPIREQDGVSGDEMDVARSMSEVETHARLMERAEIRLREIDAALDRLEAGDYGICANCGDEIPLARLKIVPFADYCVDCQSAMGNASRLARGPIGRSFAHPVAPEASAAAEEPLELGLPPEEELVTVQADSPFGPEEGELDIESPPRRKRGRPRKNPL
jgi:DnaK suppressor protein